jgi:hypothetical protein
LLVFLVYRPLRIERFPAKSKVLKLRYRSEVVPSHWPHHSALFQSFSPSNVFLWQKTIILRHPHKAVQFVLSLLVFLVYRPLRIERFPAKSKVLKLRYCAIWQIEGQGP